MNNKIKNCGCGEKEFLQVLPKFNKKQVFCVNCGNIGQAMATEDKAIDSWNRFDRFIPVLIKNAIPAH